MISTASATEDSRYPIKHEVNAMAKRLVKYYAMIRQVIKQKAKVPPLKKPQDAEINSDVAATDYDDDSSASTIILERSPVSPMGTLVLDLPPRASIPVQHQDSSDEAWRGHPVVPSYPSFPPLTQALTCLLQYLTCLLQYLYPGPSLHSSSDRPFACMVFLRMTPSLFETLSLNWLTLSLLLTRSQFLTFARLPRPGDLSF
ncbi:uncharacterized protein AKAME5_002227800 [Lates japonicus]|uniref:Uncharacterized protein n=1 Tax=Lates japonicus TaxID=270547 RepID=A0AAD3NEI8_LATJO|nr:uncharacterized protein AKAME5_002227800 [Lates japonicus]